MNTKEVEVTLIKKEVVTVQLPKNEDHWLPLSNLDLCILHPLDFSIFLCYKKPTYKDNGNSMAMVEVLKKALKEALVPYYFLAGEKVPDSMGEHKLHCNNSGVDFTEAFANIELQKLNLNEPDETIGCKLVPKKKNGVLAIQATGFKCGGLVLACTFDHQIVDAYSAGMFLVSWAEITRSKPFSSLPTFNCAMLNPRHPVSFDPSLHNLYVPITMFNSSNDPEPSANHFENRICLVKANIIKQLQSQASTKERKRTKLESFSALLWKISAKSAKNKRVSKLGIVVDGRTMLSFGDKEKRSLMSSYFGNVLSIPYDSKKIDELIEKPLSWVANEVHGFLEGAKTKEHFLDLIDWVEAHRPVQSLAKVYSSGNKEGPALVVSSGQHFPISKVDFGWGKSAFGSFYFPWGGNIGYVMPIPSPSGNGDWVVYMHMLKGTILCASYWSAWSAREAAIEQDKLFKDAADEIPIAEAMGNTGVVDINTTSAVLFVVIASCFLVVLYELMSYWFLELLVVLFCIGGIEGLQTCLVALLSRWFKRTAESYVKVPFFGAVSFLTLAVSPLCIAFAVVWAVKRDVSFAWIGQDILVLNMGHETYSKLSD